MDSSDVRKCDKGTPLSVIDGGSVYMGRERRKERRNECKNMRMESLLKSFGLDRRIDRNRRKADTSWLLISDKVINE